MNTLRFTRKIITGASLALGVLFTTPVAVADTLSNNTNTATDNLSRISSISDLGKQLNKLTDNGTRIVFIHNANKELIHEVTESNGGYAKIYDRNKLYHAILESDGTTVSIFLVRDMESGNGIRGGTQGSDM